MDERLDGRVYVRLDLFLVVDLLMLLFPEDRDLLPGVYLVLREEDFDFPPMEDPRVIVELGPVYLLPLVL